MNTNVNLNLLKNNFNGISLKSIYIHIHNKLLLIIKYSLINRYISKTTKRMNMQFGIVVPAMLLMCK